MAIFSFLILCEKISRRCKLSDCLVRSEKLFKFFYGDFTVTHDLRQKATTDCFTGMYRYYRTPTVNMLKEIMAAFTSDDLKAHFPKSLDKALARDSGEVAHAVTATRWTPINSVAAGSSISRQSSIASLTLFIKTSRDFACVWHPRNVGTEATKYPSSSFSITTLTSLFIFAILRFSSIIEGIFLHLQFGANGDLLPPRESASRQLLVRSPVYYSYFIFGTAARN